LPDDELVQEAVAAILAHQGILTNPGDPSSRNRNARVVARFGNADRIPFSTIQARALNVLTGVTGFLHQACPNPGTLPQGFAWGYQGYSLHRVLALVWNVIRSHDHKDELTRILIENLYYGDTADNSGGALCPNGQCTYALSTLIGFVDIPINGSDPIFDPSAFYAEVFSTSGLTLQERRALAINVLARMGILNDNPVRDAYVRSVIDMAPDYA